jgi:hypothetical protein
MWQLFTSIGQSQTGNELCSDRYSLSKDSILDFEDHVKNFQVAMVVGDDDDASILFVGNLSE